MTTPPCVLATRVLRWRRERRTPIDAMKDRRLLIVKRGW